MPLPANFHVHFQGVGETLEEISAASAELLTPVVVANAAAAAETWLSEMRKACASKEKGRALGKAAGDGSGSGGGGGDAHNDDEGATSDPMTFLWIANHALQTSKRETDDHGFSHATLKEAFAPRLARGIRLLMFGSGSRAGSGSGSTSGPAAQVARLLAIWKQRGVYGSRTLDKLGAVLRGELNPDELDEGEEEARFYFAEDEGAADEAEAAAIAASLELEHEDSESEYEEDGASSTGGNSSLGSSESGDLSTAASARKLARAHAKETEARARVAVLREKVAALPKGITDDGDGEGIKIEALDDAAALVAALAAALKALPRAEKRRLAALRHCVAAQERAMDRTAGRMEVCSELEGLVSEGKEKIRPAAAVAGGVWTLRKRRRVDRSQLRKAEQERKRAEERKREEREAFLRSEKEKAKAKEIERDTVWDPRQKRYVTVRSNDADDWRD